MATNNSSNSCNDNGNGNIKYICNWRDTQIKLLNNTSLISQKHYCYKIKQIEKKISNIKGIILYDEWRKCLLCNEVIGLEEFIHDEFCWNSLYTHYLDKHNIPIDKQFETYINTIKK
jgi:hypothetical protein